MQSQLSSNFVRTMDETGLNSNMTPAAPVRKTTWLDQVPTPPLISEFVSDHYNYDHYVSLAERAKDLISRGLKALKDANGQGVQAKVTCRGKEKESLEEKLKMRNDRRPKEYTTIPEIWKDIHDLAGVRILLYTPSSEEYIQVEAMIRRIWGKNVRRKPQGGYNAPVVNSLLPEADDGWTIIPESQNIRSGKQYIPRHAGYQAIHYRASMNKEEEPIQTSRGLYSWMRQDRVEIQVVSAFGHAWAEAEHNVKYKSLAFGRPTKQEERILDSLSGLVSSGDLLLEQFREIFDKRTYKKILHRDDFGTFLRDLDIIEDPDDEDSGSTGHQDDFGREGVDILFRFLVKRGQNYPLAVRNALRKLGYPDESYVKLKECIKTFDPILEPPQGLLTPLCLIQHFLLEDKNKAKGKEVETPIENYSPDKQLRIMMIALILLQTFAGSLQVARKFLQDNTNKMDMSASQLSENLEPCSELSDSLDFVLGATNEKNVLKT
ncbi:hypothetical protein GQ44DRAFT_85636 [Phaeosphaeriaceae sp. PMI808]|nr:hypothetical protein GQ44DRAFT_85636 [Phaeosphaeriaceae sp. PMI808]